MGGGPEVRNVNESTSSQIQAFTKFFPEFLQTISRETLPIEQNLLAGRREISPGQLDLQADLLEQFGPRFNRIGSELDLQNRLFERAGDVEVLEGPGAELIDSVLAQAKRIDPGFFAAKEATGQGLSELISGLDFSGGLSGGERAEVERRLAQENQQLGLSGTPTSTGTVSNALNFGRAASARQDNLAQILQRATSALPGLRTGLDPLQIALGRSGTPNVGQGQFTGSREVGATTQGLAGNFFNQIAATGRQQNAALAAKPTFSQQLSQFIPSSLSFGG
ncbi:MAG: hypothetical protein V3T23_06200 [Nitrososphaerales archaeon]